MVSTAVSVGVTPSATWSQDKLSISYIGHYVAKVNKTVRKDDLKSYKIVLRHGLKSYKTVLRHGLKA